MKKKRSILICTVGTSLFESNLKKIDQKMIDKNRIYEEMKIAFDEKRWKDLAKLMIKLDPKDKICGAEINTIQEYMTRENFNIEKLFFLVSDTDEGMATGEVLKNYFNLRENLKLTEEDIEYKVIKDLQDKEPRKFKINGLRNLVRQIGEIINIYGKENIAIDATGGYKAQIAVAVIIGQALDIPVYYKHERFSEIIEFSPLPVTMDYRFIGKYPYLFQELEDENLVELARFNNIIERNDYEKMKLFFEEEIIDNQNVISLNAIGQLYLTSFKINFKKENNLPDAKKEDRKKPSFRDDHYPIGFKEYVKKVWEENLFIKTCTSLPYDKQKSIDGKSFYVFDNGNDTYLVGTYEDKNIFKARFRLFLSNENPDALYLAAYMLNTKYR